MKSTPSLPPATPAPVSSPAQEVAAAEREVRRALLQRFRL
ncbi:hypothetical protein GGR33_004641 [Methylobacterium brachythecii]|uniref:Uncharacterized protein n=1 Tax=Methylobacterium brachythecii TaxID=1176177 RepID=A0A7W6AM16_9HYPH|nr:hypothetical protein [Methylobacterium brachythecii]